MTAPPECWWDSAPELIEPQWQLDGPASARPLGPFSGVTTNPMLMLAACKLSPPTGRARSGWDLYLACAARSAAYLRARQVFVPFCVQVDPRSAFDAPSMLAQAAEIRERMPGATIKIPLTMAGLAAIDALSRAGAAVNATWGFCVAQLVAAARAVAPAPQPDAPQPDAPQPDAPRAGRPAHVLTLMQGRLGDLGLSRHVGSEPRRLRAAECAVLDAAYESLRRHRDAATLLASSLRAGPGRECWHYGATAGRQVILTLPPSFLREQGLPASDVDYGRPDERSRRAVLAHPAVARYAAADGFEPAEFDLLPPLVATRQEAVRAMLGFDGLASRG